MEDIRRDKAELLRWLEVIEREAEEKTETKVGYTPDEVSIVRWGTD